MKLESLSLPLLCGLAILGFASCTDYTDPYGSPPPPYYGGGYGSGYDYDYERRRREEEYRQERRDDRDRERDIRRERERLEEERRRLEAERNRPPPPPPPRHETCPSGFSPSERKCTNEERRRGCRDMRLPGGLGCVSR